jgi:hypothetical protein
VASGDGAEDGSEEQIESRSKVVLSVYALKCQGRSSDFTLLPWTILVAAQKFTLHTAMCGCVPTADLQPRSIDLEPATPPP